MINEIIIRNCVAPVGTKEIYDEVITGLTSQQKYIPCKYFYDTTGSELFEMITHSEDYYPTRTEKQILSNLLNLIRLNLQNLHIIELGSGDPSKIMLLLKQIPGDLLQTISYYPVDICESEIIKSTEIISRTFSLNNIEGIVADFHHKLYMLPKEGCKLFCFFGSTIGNFTVEEIRQFMQHLDEEMKSGDALLLGVDMIKDTHIIEKAYNDSEGITARFNLNMLNVINRIAGTDFRTHDFCHYAFFNKEKKRVEMHLKALKDIIVMPDNSSGFIIIRKNETIHTENCHKFTYERIMQLCRWGRFSQYTISHDPQGWFSLVYAVK